MAWDKVTGKPLSKAINWNDARTEPFCHELKAGGHEPLVKDRTGLPLSTYFSGNVLFSCCDRFHRDLLTLLPRYTLVSATKIRWILDNVPEARAAVDAGTALVGNLDAWLVWRLSAGALFVTGGARTVFLHCLSRFVSRMVHAPDVSNASRTQLMNLSSLAWDDELCALFGVPKSILPTIRSVSSGLRGL